MSGTNPSRFERLTLLKAPGFAGGSLLAAWGSLEAMVRDVLLAWLANEPGALRNGRAEAIKVPLLKYNAMRPEERNRYILDTLERDTDSHLKSGVGRFSELFDAFGLGFGVSPALRRDLLELSLVRNAIVHNGGVADLKYAEKVAEWAPVQVGDRVEVDVERYLRLVTAAVNYAIAVHARVRQRFTDEGSSQPGAPNGDEKTP